MTATASETDCLVSIYINGERISNGSSAEWETSENLVTVIVSNDGIALKTYVVRVTKS